jgi:hypothetical protein
MPFKANVRNLAHKVDTAAMAAERFGLTTAT